MKVVLGLGSNMGQKAGRLTWVVERLRTLGELRTSSLYSSSPLECPPDSDEFVNAVVILQNYRGGLYGLLRQLQAWELEAGRAPQGCREINAPRPLDLDILDCCGVQLQTKSLVLPHPRAVNRLFVLMPWAELEEHAIVAGTPLSVGAHLAKLLTTQHGQQCKKIGELK